MEQVMTTVPAQKAPAHARAAAATVADIMRTPLTTVSRHDHVAAAAYLMKHAGTTALMVVDAQTGRPAGIITEADVAHAIADGKDVNDVWVDAVMTTRPAVITTTSIRDAAEIMTARHVHHLPVTGGAGLLGVVDITDVCQALINSGAQITRPRRYPACPAQAPGESPGPFASGWDLGPCPRAGRRAYRRSRLQIRGRPTVAPKHPARRPSAGARRAGYGLAIVFSTALLVILNGSPGWQAIPFLTSDTAQVLWLVNLSLAAGIAANLVYLAYDPPWLKSLGDLVTTGIGLAAAIRIWQVFPFDLSSGWSTAVRVLLAVAITGSCIALVVQIVALARWLTGHTSHGRRMRTGH